MKTLKDLYYGFRALPEKTRRIILFIGGLVVLVVLNLIFG